MTTATSFTFDSANSSNKEDGTIDRKTINKPENRTGKLRETAYDEQNSHQGRTHKSDRVVARITTEGGENNRDSISIQDHINNFY